MWFKKKKREKKYKNMYMLMSVVEKTNILGLLYLLQRLFEISFELFSVYTKQVEVPSSRHML